MKIELILFFIVACMAQEEDNYPLTEYPLLQDSFADIATMRHLDSYLVSRRNGVMPCYANHKEELKSITINFRKSLTKAQNNFKNVAKNHKKLVSYSIKLLIEVSDKSVSCQNAVWGAMENDLFMNAANILWDCRADIPKSIKRYESNLKNIKDENSRKTFKKKMDEIIAEAEDKYKVVNEKFEKCVKDTP